MSSKKQTQNKYAPQMTVIRGGLYRQSKKENIINQLLNLCKTTFLNDKAFTSKETLELKNNLRKLFVNHSTLEEKNNQLVNLITLLKPINRSDTTQYQFRIKIKIKQ